MAGGNIRTFNFSILNGIVFGFGVNLDLKGSVFVLNWNQREEGAGFGYVDDFASDYRFLDLAVSLVNKDYSFGSKGVGGTILVAEDQNILANFKFGQIGLVAVVVDNGQVFD